MTAEEYIKKLLGEHLMQIAVLCAQLDAAKAKVKELEATAPPKAD